MPMTEVASTATVLDDVRAAPVPLCEVMAVAMQGKWAGIDAALGDFANSGGLDSNGPTGQDGPPTDTRVESPEMIAGRVIRQMDLAIGAGLFDGAFDSICADAVKN